MRMNRNISLGSDNPGLKHNTGGSVCLALFYLYILFCPFDKGSHCQGHKVEIGDGL